MGEIFPNLSIFSFTKFSLIIFWWWRFFVFSDLFKLSNGKYIAPQLIESLLKQSALVNQVVVVGAGRKQPAALIVPDWESLKSALRAAEISVEGSHAELCRDAKVVKLVQTEIIALTASLDQFVLGPVAVFCCWWSHLSHPQLRQRGGN